MENTALITGTSSGIGYELAKVFARNKINLVLTARNIKKLEELKSELESRYSISVHTIGKDLSKISSVNEIYDENKAKKYQYRIPY